MKIADGEPTLLETGGRLGHFSWQISTGVKGKIDDANPPTQPPLLPKALTGRAESTLHQRRQ